MCARAASQSKKLRIPDDTECQVAPDTTPKSLEILEGENLEVHGVRERLVSSRSRVKCSKGNNAESLVLNRPNKEIPAVKYTLYGRS